MQWVLGRLKGRLGVAVVLTLIVLATVGIGRAVGGGGAGATRGPRAQSTVPDVPSAEDDGVEDGPSVAPQAPSLRPGAAQPLNIAGRFISAWLQTQLAPPQWHAGLKPYATVGLAEKLSGVDPAGVPAQRTTGNATLAQRSVGSAAVTVPVDSGTVELRLIVIDGEWLVDGVDWSRG